MAAPVKYSHKLTLRNAADREQARKRLYEMEGVVWQEKSEQYCDYRLDGTLGKEWLRIKQYTNGTCFVEASTPEFLESGVREITQTSGQITLLVPQNVPESKPVKSSGQLFIEGAYIGTDESGKGDYFGPLVIAGVYVSPQTITILQECGVMDSKKLSEKAIDDLAQKIFQIVGESAVSVIEIGPKRYNELYEQFKQRGRNLNHLLAWGHARAIENLLIAYGDCTQAVADQFGSEHYILSQLQEKAKQIKLYQTPRAEANVGVAAASIIARYRFVKRLKKLSQQFQLELPLGAGPHVKAQAKRFVAEYGREKLTEVVKLHFKTTQEL